MRYFPTSPELFATVRAYLEFVWETAKAAHTAGVAPLDAARDTDLGPYAEWHDRERLVGNLHRAFSELDGRPHGAPLDLGLIWSEMLAYNGGRPLRCLA